MQTVETTTSSPNSTNAVLNEGSFSVHSYSLINMDNADKLVHWSKGLNMIIVKDGVTVKLNSEEIEQLVKALPRTVGGKY